MMWEGKEYLDFAAGIAVFSLGYNHPEYSKTLKEQIDKLLHTSNLYYNVPMVEAAEKLTKAAGLSKVFFTNSERRRWRKPSKLPGNMRI